MKPLSKVAQNSAVQSNGETSDGKKDQQSAIDPLSHVSILFEGGRSITQLTVCENSTY